MPPIPTRLETFLKNSINEWLSDNPNESRKEIWCSVTIKNCQEAKCDPYIFETYSYSPSVDLSGALSNTTFRGASILSLANNSIDVEKFQKIASAINEFVTERDGLLLTICDPSDSTQIKHYSLPTFLDD